ncbi:8-oxoguanine DNA glycosylase OGG fold protein [Epilithonimonas hungarica]|uniref:Uncharacterized protein n=1 Tax=Epilithonimonas hungarica TaxID=454006 RepID=A0A1G7IIX0_9FLAO|nr:hypothetical protein [Epilithonimonas hungarica]SDF12593.1 hypothetical protein SAMN05421825_1100 [Epilithonimonas hungarica]
MKINNYIEIIGKLNPLEESKFEYKSTVWNNLNEDLKKYLFDFENKPVSRKAVIESFKNYYIGKVHFSVPFGLTMVWGFGDTGYGTYRTNNYYSQDNHKKFIENSFQFVANNQIENAYKELQKIKGLNISYISKLLYFASRAQNHQSYCLIYDIRVAKSLVKLNCPEEIFEILDIKPSNKYIHYNKYNLLIHKVAKENNVSAEALEMFLFNQSF